MSFIKILWKGEKEQKLKVVNFCTKIFLYGFILGLLFLFAFVAIPPKKNPGVEIIYSIFFGIPFLLTLMVGGIVVIWWSWREIKHKDMHDYFGAGLLEVVFGLLHLFTGIGMFLFAGLSIFILSILIIEAIQEGILLPKIVDTNFDDPRLFLFLIGIFYFFVIIRRSVK